MPNRTPFSPKRLYISDAAQADIRRAIGYLAREAGNEVAARFLENIDAELIKRAELAMAACRGNGSALVSGCTS